MNEFPIDKALQRFADLMIAKIECVSNDPSKPWFSTAGHGLPQNVDGRVYHGMNSIILFALCEECGYQTPVFMTFLQAKAKGVNVLKGETSFPVVYWEFSIKNDSGVKISLSEYNSLGDDEKKNYSVTPFTRIYNIFNVDQTNYSEIHPDQWEGLKQKFGVKPLMDTNGMLSCPELDEMLRADAWLCPIISKAIDRAFYRPSEDKIFIPLKGQFYTGERFYSTMLHEMTHSTATDSRCAREIKNRFGDPKYAKEELIAEFTAAVTCNSLGIVSGIQEENAKYLKNWQKAIKQEPQFLYSVLSDVGKASSMILNEVCHELTVSVPSQAIPAMTEEQYLASKGFSNDFGDSALHKGKQKSQRLQERMINRQSEKDREYSSKRSELRKEYQEKIDSGALRAPTIVEQLIKVANGMPELESVQAARRALEKRGVSWNEEKVKNEHSFHQQKNITSDFTNAIVAALGGQFQSLVELKQKGFSPSTSDLEILKNIAPTIRPAVETIFQIRIDPLQFIKLAESDNQIKEKQLSFNF